MLRRTTRFRLALIASLITVTASPGHAAVIFGDGFGHGLQLTLSESAVAAAAGSTTKSDNKSDQRTIMTLPSTPIVTSVAALISDTGGANVYSASASGTLSITFNSAASASIRSTGTATATGSGSGSAYASGSLGLAYYFTTTSADPFTISYLLSSQTLGCCGNSIQLDRVSGNFQSILQRTIYNADNQGTLTSALTAGTYRLTISKNEYSGYDAPLIANRTATATFAHDDLFTFQIGALDTPSVPEPATWATMIAGFGLAGGVMRRRHRASALA